MSHEPLDTRFLWNQCQIRSNRGRTLKSSDLSGGRLKRLISLNVQNVLLPTFLYYSYIYRLLFIKPLFLTIYFLLKYILLRF